jgi:hypothetical protein
VEFTVTATDLCDPSVAITCTTPWGEVVSGDVFPVGMTTVTCTARDMAGNTATCSLNILVRDVEPPVITGPDAIEVMTDAEGTPVSVTLALLQQTFTDNCSGGLSVGWFDGLLEPGTNEFYFWVYDQDLNRADKTMTITVLKQGQVTTEDGADVAVQSEPELPDGSTTTVGIQFDQVVSGGVTTVTASDEGTPPPDGFKLGDPPVYYDVSTTAEFTGSVELCFTWQEGQIANEGNLRLWHFENDTWVDITTSVDTEANVICGVAGSLSPFIVAEIEYDFGGIRQPINADGSSVFKANRTIPVKFQLRLPDGSFARDVVARVWLYRLTETIEGTVEEEEVDLGEGDEGNVCRYDAGDEQYVFNLGTKGLATGTYRLEILLDDGTVHPVNLSLR